MPLDPEKEVERLKNLVAELHKGVCSGYADLLDRYRQAERTIASQKEEILELEKLVQRSLTDKEPPEHTENSTSQNLKELQEFDRLKDEMIRRSEDVKEK